MTTDTFTDAARAEAEVQCGNSFDLEHFMAGAGWARSHLAAQEPTDAECIAFWYAFEDAADETNVENIRAALRAARAARRDEEER